MDVSTVPLPKMDRGDEEVVLISRRFVGGKARQKAAVNAVSAYWRNLPLPSDFRSMNCFESVDGENVMTVVQWRGEDSWDRFFRSRRPFMIPGVETADDARRLRPELYRRYRGQVAEEEGEAVCVVVPTFDVDGPERQRRAVDTLLDGPLNARFPGLRAMHFLLSGDRAGC